MNKTTYTYSVAYKKNNLRDYIEVRAYDELDACLQACELVGDITIIGAVRVGN